MTASVSIAIPLHLQGYQRANLVTAEELALIKRVDRQPRAKVESILVTDGQVYATLYLRLLKKLVRVDTMQYILVMVGDALLGRWALLSWCYRYSSGIANLLRRP